MKTYITTIEELKGKTRCELDAIFRKAAEIACSAGSAAAEKEAARQTIELVRRSLLVRFDGP